MLDAIEEIRQHPEEYRRLDYAQFKDYFQARWGRTVSNYYHKSKQIKWWKDIMQPALTDAGVECTTVHMPTERASRPAVYSPEPGAVAEKIAGEVKAKNLTRIDSKVVERCTPKSGRAKHRKPTKKTDNWPSHDELRDHIQTILDPYPKDNWVIILLNIRDISDDWTDEIQATYHPKEAD
jgi:hypothetical protein